MLAWPATVFVILSPPLTRELASLRHDIGFNKPFFFRRQLRVVPCLCFYPPSVFGPIFSVLLALLIACATTFVLPLTTRILVPLSTFGYTNVLAQAKSILL